MFRAKFCAFLLAFKLLAALVAGTSGANILALLSSASRSHHIFQTTILEELANRGHNVTFPKTKTF